jgi:hypothetical protein
MSQHDNEALAHRFHMDIFQKGELRVADEIIASNLFGEIPSFLPSCNMAQMV